jgi:hypothetical protein
MRAERSRREWSEIAEKTTERGARGSDYDDWVI